MKEKYITKKKAVGKETERKESLSQSYSLYDTCDKCPLWVYIDLVCDNKLDSLIIDGNPSKEVLEAVKSELIFEFNEISGHSDSIDMNIIRKIYLLGSKLNGLKLNYHLISDGVINNESLKKYGIYSKDKDKIIREIESKIKNIIVLLDSEKKKYNELMSDKKNIRRQDFDEQIIAISKHNKFHINKIELTLSQYAVYLKDYKTYLELNNGRNK